MKRINFAYEWALRHPPSPPSATVKEETQNAWSRTPDPPIMCPSHGYQAMGRCTRCGQPLCLGCLGFRQSLCNTHYQRQKIRRARARALREWGPLIGIIFGLRALGLPGLYIGVAVLCYLAILGLRLLISRRWLGCLALLLLPYSLVLAGVWSLWESLRDWNGHPSGKAKTG